MQTSSLRRQMKNMVNNYTEAEIKVREATSNDPWGPPSSLMSEIADLTFNVVAFTEVMGMIWKRLNDHGKNWRHVYKALLLLDYLIKTGSERVAKECRENIYTIQTLRDFQYLDRDGRDQGSNVREKAKQLAALLRDEDKLKKERGQALKTKTRMAGATSSISSGSLPPPYPGRRISQTTTPAGVYGEDLGRGRTSPTSFHSSSSSPRLAPDLEQARPSTSGEEELQLQLALAMSREESEKPPVQVDFDEQTQLQIAMNLSKEETRKPTVQRAPATADMDEETQLQLALSLSKEEHQQEQLSRQGDESMLQKALEESKREMQAKGGTSFMDLVDVFAVPSDMPPSDPRWNNTSHQAAAARVGADTWDSAEGSNISSRVDPPWMAPPPSNSPPPPWEPPSDPWHVLPNNDANVNVPGRVWSLPANTAPVGVDPFSAPSETTKLSRAVRDASFRSGSPSDGDLFDEALDGGYMDEMGEPSEPFDLSHMRESLVAPSPRKCRTPEAFLGPAAASLVNLDTLIPANSSATIMNPFLSGVSAPSPSNPFQNEQPKLTLNQMGSSSSAFAAPATSLPYSASLPLPMSHQPASLPSSLTHPTQPGLELPGNLPEPLLPFSSVNTQGPQASQSSQNPFL